MNRKPSSRPRATILPLLVGAAAVAASLAATPAAAQQAVGPMISPTVPRAINPSLSLTAPAPGPIQQQVQDDYATSLMGAQRQLLQQNPSGVTRQELAIGRQLNGYTGPR
jgi:hypothetical protein